MTLKIGSVVIDSQGPIALARFWAAALGYETAHEEAGWVRIVDPDVRNAGLSFQREDGPKTGSNRLHFDLYTSSMTAEVERLKSLGATVKRENREPDDLFTVMLDPEGNEFCVCQKE
ncbi:MAG: VOC family protein [Armatimonadetes bacterium]|nr:VOC family protein [Armatimonadota bacterium]